MAYRRVLAYQALWNSNQHIGRIILKLDGETGQPEMGIFDPPEFHAIIDILRNEAPVLYDRNLKQLCTGEEVPGEGEN
ncbi:MAG TPA: hypothetical protein VFR08_02740 [Candidatus Angelobacter sp.]|nr:hypothetical protein [Candidatus Angelobacter sp.]